MRRVIMSLAAIALLVASALPCAAQTVLEGRIVGVSRLPIKGGSVRLVGLDSFDEQAQVRKDGSFSLHGIDIADIYMVVFSDSWGVDHVLSSLELEFYTGQQLSFEARNGRLRLLTALGPPQDLTPPVRFGLRGEWILLLGDRFNGGFDARPGYGATAFLQRPVAQIPLLGSPAPHNAWEFALHAALNRYEELPQRLDPTLPPGDADFARVGISTGLAFASESESFEFGLGVSASFGGFYDGGDVIKTSREGEFNVNSYGLYLHSAMGIPAGRLNLMVHSRVDFLTTTTGHEAEFWSGNLVGLSFGLGIQ